MKKRILCASDFIISFKTEKTAQSITGRSCYFLRYIFSLLTNPCQQAGNGRIAPSVLLVIATAHNEQYFRTPLSSLRHT